MEANFDLEMIKESIIKNLKHVFDPEIPVNIYDLGLIYNIELEAKGPYLFCLITMTLTSPGCPVADSLLQQVKYVALAVNEVDECDVDLVFEPQWDMSKISQEGQDLLIMNGVVIPEYK